MRIISWNVNGIRATTQKLKDGSKNGCPTNNVIKTLIEEQHPDILCFQEVKTQSQQDLECLRPHFKYILTNFSKHKKGYSGVAMLTNEKPQWVSYDFKMYSEEQIGPYNTFAFTDEGRIITARFNSCVVVVVYVPNAQPELARIKDRIVWEEMIRKYLSLLKTDNSVPIILVGDLNVAPTPLDIHDPRGKNKTPGYSPEERAEFQKILDIGFTNIFRHVYPDKIKYSYFSNFANSRENNKGWLIDHYLISEINKIKVNEVDILEDFFGSDHLPILLDFTKISE